MQMANIRPLFEISKTALLEYPNANAAPGPTLQRADLVTQRMAVARRSLAFRCVDAPLKRHYCGRLRCNLRHAYHAVAAVGLFLVQVPYSIQDMVS